MSNRLPILAEQIRQAKSEADQLAAQSANRAIDAGKALIEAKGLCPRGGWLPFLKETGINERTAQRYMKLAASDLQSDTVSLLGGVTAALRFLRMREAAMHHLENAWDASEAIDRGEEADELRPLEWALHHMEQMARMFPDYDGRAFQ